jgi:dephospho-CoA kinase
LIADHGVSTIDADAIGHSVLEPGGGAFAAIAERWPSVLVDDKVDRASLASIVFADPSQLEELEGITHPLIFGRISAQVEDIVEAVVVEIPLIRKAPPGEWRRLVVDCDDEIRLARVIGRGMSRGDAEARMASQPSRQEWLAVADMVIPNHRSESELAETVAAAIPMLVEPWHSPV